MDVPLLDLRRQQRPIDAELRAAIDRVLESGRFILGPEVEALEARVAALSGTAHGVGVSSGTDALLVALMAAGVGPGDEVVVPAFSFFATAGVVVRLGATPVLVDIDPATFCLDAEAAAAALGGRTRAVIPVHLYGRCADLDPVLDAAAGRDILVLEDAAQAIGARDAAGRPAGSIGGAGAFSFYPTKNLGGIGDGGMVVTSDDALADSMRLLRVHGDRGGYRHVEVGGNFRLDALQAAVLGAELPHLAEWTAARREHAARYRSLFRAAGIAAGGGPGSLASAGDEGGGQGVGADRVVLPEDVPGHVYHQFVIRAPRRDQLAERLASEGVGTAVYYPVPFHLQPCFDELGYREGDFPHAEEAAREVLALPIHPGLTGEEQAYVVERIAAFYRE